MPAVSALLHPDEARLRRGGPRARHPRLDPRAQHAARPPSDERELAFRAADTLEKLTGVRPVGMRTPSWDFSDATLGIIRELGLAYDSSLMADDELYEMLADGEPTGMVEMPVEWIRDDAPYFTMDRYTALRPYTPPRAC